jgi:hypothetical protein
MGLVFSRPDSFGRFRFYSLRLRFVNCTVRHVSKPDISCFRIQIEGESYCRIEYCQNMFVLRIGASMILEGVRSEEKIHCSISIFLRLIGQKMYDAFYLIIYKRLIIVLIILSPNKISKAICSKSIDLFTCNNFIIYIFHSTTLIITA